jgi:hypothetical protein
VKPTPTGNAPLTDNVVGDGYPAVVVTVNAPAEPTANTAASALVITGFLTTVSVNAWVAFGLTPLLAVIVIGKDPDTDGVPARVAVPSPLSVKLSPAGNTPVRVIAGVGVPVVVTVNEPAEPTANVAELALVNAGALPTVSEAALVVALPTVLVNTAR